MRHIRWIGLLLASLAMAGCAASGQAISVRSFGAAGDGKTADTAAFQKALDQIAKDGGGKLDVPAGNYLIGSIELKSNTTLHLEKDATLVSTANPDDFPIMDVRWEGKWRPGHRGMIYANHADNISIVGEGHIEGCPDLGALRNPRGPVLIEPIECNNVLIEGISTHSQHMWNIHPTYCEHFTARNLVERSENGGQSDGIDVDSTEHVLIENCDINTGDDCIALKSGRGAEAVRIARPTTDVLIRNCKFNSQIFGAIGIGSEMSGGVRDVRIENCTITSAYNALYLKSRIGRGGFIENVSASHLDGKVRAAFLRIDLMNRGIQDDPVPGPAGIAEAKNITLTDSTVECQTFADASVISDGKPLDGLVIRNITGTCKKGMLLSNILNADLDGIALTGFAGPLLSVHNVTGKGLEGGINFVPSTAPDRPTTRRRRPATTTATAP